MTEKVTVKQAGQLPMPLIYLASTEELAQWYVSQLEWALEHGERELTMSCFTTENLGFPTARAAAAVLKAVMDVLYDHPEVESLTVLCAGEEAYRTYSLHWNMWYAPYKPHHSHDETL